MFIHSLISLSSSLSDISPSVGNNNFFLALNAAALALSLWIFLGDFAFLTFGVDWLPDTPAGLLRVVEK